MRVVFADEKLSSIEAEAGGHVRLPIGAIATARRRLTVLRAAADDRALNGWKSLRYERLGGSTSGGRRAIRVNERYRLIFDLDDATDPQTATILMIEGML